MQVVDLSGAVREWVLSQPWLSFAHGFVAVAPAWEIYALLGAPIVIALVVLFRPRKPGQSKTSPAISAADRRRGDDMAESIDEAEGASATASAAVSTSTEAAPSEPLHSNEEVETPPESEAPPPLAGQDETLAASEETSSQKTAH